MLGGSPSVPREAQFSQRCIHVAATCGRAFPPGRLSRRHAAAISGLGKKPDVLEDDLERRGFTVRAWSYFVHTRVVQLHLQNFNVHMQKPSGRAQRLPRRQRERTFQGYS